MTTALIGNIQHYSIHDGPGIRSTVFLKGCPLTCAWCHNPENLNFAAELRWLGEKCISCGDCIQVCDRGALAFTASGIVKNDAVCTKCGLCQEECPTLALEILGHEMSATQAAEVLFRDMPFYEQSGGGVTISGGEPLSQPEFVMELTRILKEKHIHTAIDTSGYTSWEILRQCLPSVDLFLYDVKCMDSLEHEKWTGKPNDLILRNLNLLSNSGANIWLRTPIIPEVNDDESNLLGIANMASRLGIREWYLLPYHHLAESKYEKLGIPYALSDKHEPSDQCMKDLHSLVQREYRELNIHVGA